MHGIKYSLQKMILSYILFSVERGDSMQLAIIIICVIIVLIILWLISGQRRLVAMDENINNAMSQIGVQLTARFDALTGLLELIKGYDAHESETLLETVRARRTVITANSTAADVAAQENVITDALGKINAVAEQYPALRSAENYKQAMGAVERYEGTLRSARLVYNDSVTKLNRAIRMFPTSLIAGMLHFSAREYLKTEQEKTARPEMK